MKQEFEQYLADVGMGGQFTDQIAKIHDQCADLNNNDFKQIFASNTYTIDGIKPLSIHLFAESHLYTCKDFTAPFNVEIRPIGRISSCEITKSYFDLKARRIEHGGARLVVSVKWDLTTVSMQFHATDVNCIRLADILYNILIPQITHA